MRFIGDDNDVIPARIGVSVAYILIEAMDERKDIRLMQTEQ